MRSDWITKKIGDVCEIHRGASPRPIQNFLSDKGMPWVKIADATGSNSRYILKTSQYIIEEGISKSVLVTPGTLIVSNSATPGLPKILGITACVHDGWLILSNFKGVIRDFLFYKFIDIREHLVNQANGSVFQNLKTEIVKDFNISFPSIPEQHKIVSLLSMLDDKIELNNRINANLEQQAQALFKSWFVDFEPFGGVMPNDWFLSTFDNIVEFQNGYAFKSNELLNTCSENCLNVFKQGHINRGGGFKVNGTKSWIHQSQCLNLQKFILHRGDVLMAMTDMKDNVAILGNTAIMPYDNQYILNQRVGLLRPKKGTGITYAYIYILTNSDSFLSDLRSRANSGVQVNLSAEAIKSTEIIIATQEINSRFCDIITPMMEHFLNNQIEIQRLAALRDALLPKLMSGEIDVSAVNI